MGCSICVSCWVKGALFCILLTPLILPVSAYAELRVMTLNAEWLWTPNDGNVDGKKFNAGDMSKQDYKKELAFYKDLVKEHHVSLVALAEVENEQVVEEFVALLGAPWEGYFKQGRDTATGQDVALVSRLSPVEGSVSDLGFPEGRLPGDRKGKRLSKFVSAGFYHPDTQDVFWVFTSHFLSKRNDSRKKRLNRLRQSHALLNGVSQVEQKRGRVPMLVMGDLNDTLDSEVIQVLLKGAVLKSASTSCADKSGTAQSPSALIDHILYKGLSCQRFKTLSLAPFSDHPGLVAIF